MRLSTISSEGIVLGKRNYGEADRLMYIYSKSQGKVPMIAKGVRKPKSRKRGHLEIFNHIKYQSAGTRGVAILTEAEVINDFRDIKTDLKRISLAYYFMEVIGKITHDYEPNSEVFYLILDTLEKLESTKKLKTLRLNFIYELLIILGFWPRGKEMMNHDQVLQEVIERQISSLRVGKRVLN